MSKNTENKVKTKNIVSTTIICIYTSDWTEVLPIKTSAKMKCMLILMFIAVASATPVDTEGLPEDILWDILQTTGQVSTDTQLNDVKVNDVKLNYK